MLDRSRSRLGEARARAAALGPFDPARYVAGLEALGDTVRATIEPDGRLGYYNAGRSAAVGAAQRLALEIWNGSEPANVEAVIRYLIATGRVEAEPAATAH